MPDPSPSDPPVPIGDAASLFDTDELRPIKVNIPSTPTPAPASSASAPDGYDLVGYSVPEVEEPPRPVALPKPVERPRTRARPEPATEPAEPTAKVASGDSSEFEMEVAAVDPIWTRWAEWGPDLIRLVMVAIGTLVLAYLTAGNVVLCLLVLALGGAALVLLSYPILITLERPVRITPEQAVGDFFAAASHHLPHYRRMWLLLSSQAKSAGKFSTFGEFRAYWEGRIGRLKADRGAGRFTPLTFEVDSFRADKSTGKSTSRADYTIQVFLRGHEDDAPIESIKLAHGLVKGPDRMWYLNRGDLDPDAGRSRRGRG